MYPVGLAAGTAPVSSSICMGTGTSDRLLIPVTCPPERDRLLTKPARTGLRLVAWRRLSLRIPRLCFGPRGTKRKRSERKQERKRTVAGGFADTAAASDGPLDCYRARSAADVLWPRSKLGVHVTQVQRAVVAEGRGSNWAGLASACVSRMSEPAWS